ncbi:MAG: LamG domain-containing protein [Magnetococcus sp. YQC-5]
MPTGTQPPGNAIQFDGSDSYLDISGEDYSSLTNKATIEFWAYGGTSLPKTNTLIWAENDLGTRMLNVHLPWSDSVVYFDAGNATGSDRIQKTATTSEIKGQWHHWAFVKDGATMSIYLDGQPWHSGTEKNQNIGGSLIRRFLVGKGYDGKIDELRIWNTARSAVDILNNKSLVLDANQPGLIGNYHFDQASGLVARNSAVTSRDNGFMVGSASWVQSGSPVVKGTVVSGYIYYDQDNVPISNAAQVDFSTARRRVRTDASGNQFTDLPVRVTHDFSGAISSGYFDNIGNPVPSFGTNWVSYGASIDFKIDAYVRDTFRVDTRYALAGWTRAGSPFVPVDLTTVSEEAPQITAYSHLTITDATTVTYKWKAQHTVEISAMPELSAAEYQLLALEVIGSTNQSNHSGPGKWWYDRGTKLRSFAADSACSSVEGYLNSSGGQAVSTTPQSKVIGGTTYLAQSKSLPGPTDTTGLDAGVSLIWKYATPTFTEHVTVGSPVTLHSVTPSRKAQMLVHNQPLRADVQTSPNATTSENLYTWNGTEQKLYPLIGDRSFLLEWQPKVAGSCAVKTQIQTHWPAQTHYRHIANTPPVVLDSDPLDGIVFSTLQYTDADATVASGNFSSTKSGRSVLQFAQIKPPAPVQSSQLVFYQMEQITGTTLMDSSGYNNNGVLVTVSNSNRQVPSYSDNNNAVNFTGGADLISIANTNWQSITSQVTIEFWSYGGTSMPKDSFAFEAVDAQGHRVLGAHVPWGNQQIYFDAGVGTDGNSDRIQQSAPESAYKGRWNHWAFVKDANAGTMKIYLNGNLWHSGAQKTNPIHGATITSFKIGQNYDGKMDDFRIWDVARTQTEIQIDMNSSANQNLVHRNVISKNLLAYYNFDKFNDTSLPDVSGNGHDGTLTNVSSGNLVSSASFLDKAVEFQGNSKIDVTTGSFAAISTAVTIEFWHHGTAQSPSDQATILSALDANDVELLKIQVPTSDSKVKFSVGTGVIQQSLSDSDYKDQWNHWAFVKDVTSGAMNIYLNGHSLLAQTGITTPIGAIVKLKIGDQYNGKIDELRIWNKARTEAEIQNDLNRLYSPLRIVETKTWAETQTSGTATVGTEIVSGLHDSDTPHNGYLFWEKAPYNTKIYNRQTMMGEIYPVNTRNPDPDTVNRHQTIGVVWYRMQDNIAWPYQPVDYLINWPAASDPKQIVIASRFGSEGKGSDTNDQMMPDKNGTNQPYFDPDRYTDMVVYNQPDPARPGYNPNEEHALIAPSMRNVQMAPRPKAAFALRHDLNITAPATLTSQPYVLVQYLDKVTNKHGMKAYRVEKESAALGYTFVYDMKAGDPIVPPYPLDLVMGATPPAEIFGKNVPITQKTYWKDHKGTAWAISGNASLESFFWYPLDPSFWYQRDGIAALGDGTGSVGASVAWLPQSAKIQAADSFPDTMLGKDKAVSVRYNVAWPQTVPILKAGETVTFPGGEYKADHPDAPGLPGILGWSSGQVVFDQTNPTMSNVNNSYLVRIAPVLTEKTVDLSVGNFPPDLKPAGKRVDVVQGRYYFKDLNASLKSRVFYDPATGKLGMRGFINDKTIGDKTLTASPPSLYVLQPNIMTLRERDELKAITGATTAFQSAVDSLYTATRNIPETTLGPGLALMPNGALLDPSDQSPYKNINEGYVTLAENNHPDLGALPVALHVVKVVKDPSYRGAIKTVLSDNAFDEKITLRHTADFGANPNDIIFQWWYRENDGNTPPTPDLDPTKWKLFTDPTGQNGLGMSEINLAGAGAVLLADNNFFVRYRHKNSLATTWTQLAGAANSRPDAYKPQLAEGWIKRVLFQLNPFEARIKNFSNSDAPATYVSMIQQSGARYEGPVAFNPAKDVIENVGLIELYQTILGRGKALSIDLPQPASTSGVTAALMLAASRIQGFYTLLGNEAYTDSLDPTIGVGSSSTDYGSLTPTIFTFQNQVPTLLEEELSLLRGRADAGARPAYNRLLWNFTKGDGEVAYALSYNISDVNKDGFVNVEDARILYPQGHGDAWGHYLSALKSYYDLLRNPNFNWESRAESISMQGVVIDVDYLDERKFAESAAAKAKTGAEIVHLTYRSRYVENPAGQYQGYKDTDVNRAWGVQEWGARAGQGALFDWAVANAILPSVDADPTHTGLKKIDRTTVMELQEIAAHARDIQVRVDNADNGLNPLGIVADAVPFDIDPAQVQNGVTHFEQVSTRAGKALDNALIVFNNASGLKNRIRQVANSAQEFTEQVDQQDRDYRNQLITLFGTPYEGTIGAGKVYPEGYQGPDYFLYNYIDVNTVSASTVPPPSGKITGFFTPLSRTFSVVDQQDSTKQVFTDMATTASHFFQTDLLNAADVTKTDFSRTLNITFPLSAGSYSFQAPADWGIRKSPGTIQQSLIELVKSEADLQIGLSDYSELLHSIQNALDLLQARSDLQTEELSLVQAFNAKNNSLKDSIGKLRALANTLTTAGEWAKQKLRDVADGVPAVVGLANDATFMVRTAVKLASAPVQMAFTMVAKGAEYEASQQEKDLEIAKQVLDITIKNADYKYEIQQKIKEVETLLRHEATKRLEIFRLKENMLQVSEKYRSNLANGLRLLDERQAYNAKVSAKTQGKRYEDMAFRVSMNDALSKYRDAFDLAARYLYLAAKAYDYETNLSDQDPASAKSLLSAIMQARTLGQMGNTGTGWIVGGGGLGEIYAKLKINFDNLKGQMGFNNPQTETGRFSLRYELMRIPANPTSDTAWQNALRTKRVDNLWHIPEFRKYCRPFSSDPSVSQPGLVIDFTSNVLSGKNFFGQNLGGGDHAYDPTHFATKVRSVGLWFDGYDTSLLSETPRAYLIPVGMDTMLVPNSSQLATRQWTVTDQKIPVPFPVSGANIKNSTWIPSQNGLDGSMSEIRRYSMFRAYHDNGEVNASEMTSDSRLVGRSVWNTRWMLIIPGATLDFDSSRGLENFIQKVKDIKMFFQTYAISGN